MAARRGKKQARRSGGSAGTPGWVWLLVGLLIGGVVAVAFYLKMPRASDNGLPHPNASAQPPKSSNTGVAPEGSAPDTTATAAQKTKFDFYTLLPEKEVVIPDEELSARVKAEAAAQAASKAQAQLPTTSANTPSVTAPTTGSSPTVVQPNAGTDTTNGSTVAAANGANATAPNTASTANPATTATTTQSGRYLLQAGAFRNGAEADNLKARIALLGLVGRVEIVQTPNGPMHRVRIGPYATASELEQAKQKLGSGGLPAVAIRVK
jgi:cell division protein FtsN